MNFIQNKLIFKLIIFVYPCRYYLVYYTIRDIQNNEHLCRFLIITVLYYVADLNSIIDEFEIEDLILFNLSVIRSSTQIHQSDSRISSDPTGNRSDFMQYNEIPKDSVTRNRIGFRWIGSDRIP
jgi:hypothetical protein